MGEIPQLEPMSDAELSKIKGQIERRWKSKGVRDFDPQGPDEHGSPACMMRAHEVLRMIARVSRKERSE